MRLQEAISTLRLGIDTILNSDVPYEQLDAALKLVEEKFTSTNNRYATALDVLNEFEEAEPYSGVTSDLWSWLHKRLTEIKPCPFCGKQPVSRFDHLCFIECREPHCARPSITRSRKDTTITAWNKRADIKE